MTDRKTLRLIQARHVDNGEDVYLTACDAWTADITIAEHLPAEDHDWRLAFANRLPEVTNARLVPAP